MKETENIKMYFYFDEAGSPAILGHHSKNLLAQNLTSKTFSVGYIQMAEPHDFGVALENLRKEILEDEYYSSIPSIKNLKNGFHANKDCHEVRDKVFHLLKKFDFEAYIIVARKSEALFRNRFDLSDKKLYEFLVSELLKNRLHLYKDIDIYFSEMSNVVSTRNMSSAINEAIAKFKNKWGKENESNIRVFVQQPSHLVQLQAIDYVLWAVYRAFENNDFRYFNFIKEKIRLVHDIFDTATNPYYGAFYTDKKPLEAKKLSPISG